MKLFVTDTGDTSVGIFPETWEIPCPFNKEDADAENLEWFRAKMIEIYREWAMGGIVASYDFEFELENEYCFEQ